MFGPERGEYWKSGVPPVSLIDQTIRGRQSAFATPACATLSSLPNYLALLMPNFCIRLPREGAITVVNRAIGQCREHVSEATTQVSHWWFSDVLRSCFAPEYHATGAAIPTVNDLTSSRIKRAKAAARSTWLRHAVRGCFNDGVAVCFRLCSMNVVVKTAGGLILCIE